MDIQEEINSELLRLDVPIMSLEGFQLDRPKNRKRSGFDHERATESDPEDLLSLLKKLPDRAGSSVVVAAIRLSRVRVVKP